MKWSEFTKTEDYQNLSPESQQKVKSEYFRLKVLPDLKADPSLTGADMNAVFKAWMQEPDDSGQGYASSVLNSTVRGPLIAMPKMLELVGDSLGIASLAEAGRQGIVNVQRAQPVNPVHAVSWPMMTAPWFVPVLVLGVILKRKVWPSAKPAQTVANHTAHPELRGVNGWLKFWCITATFLGPLHVFGRAGSFAPIYGEARKAGESVLATLLWLHLIVALCFAVWSCWVALQVWKVRPGALLRLRCFWWALVIWQVTFIALFLMLNPKPHEWRLDVLGTLISLGSMVTWVLYFIRSKRVAANFGPWSWAAYHKGPWPGLAELNLTPEEVADVLPAVSLTTEAASDNSERWMSPATSSHQEPPKDVTIQKTFDSLVGYERLAEEQRSGFVHEALWLKCFSEHDGDEVKTKAAYNRLRAAMLERG